MAANIIVKQYQRSDFHSAGILCTRLCIAQQNLSIGVNVVSKGSPSRMRSVRLISFGMTILPKSSTLLTMPVAFLYLSPFLLGTKPPLCKGRWLPVGQTEGLSLSTHHNPPVSSADSPLYTRGPFPVPTIILQITLLVSVNGGFLLQIEGFLELFFR